LGAFPKSHLSRVLVAGINLSGGQRQRCALARALYAAPELLVYDDPLSAVDAGVSAHLFERACLAPVQRGGCTLVMALNQLQYLPRVDRIVVLRDGCVASVGTFAELLATSGTFADLMREFGMHDSAEAEEEAGELGDESDAPVRVHSSNRLRDALKKRTIASPVAGETGAATTSVAIATSGASNAAQAAANVVSAAKASAALTEQVNAGTGAAESAYAVYSSAAGGYHVAALLVLMFVVHQCGRCSWG
jgi:ABC-type sulfate/molybdate transport systems ATPase subunit